MAWELTGEMIARTGSLKPLQVYRSLGKKGYPARVACTAWKGFEGGAWGWVVVAENVTSLMDDTLGLSPNLYGMGRETWKIPE